MTRFELAGRLSRGLSQLEESRKHEAINRYIHRVNTRMENGTPESEAIESLGDMENLITNILLEYNVGPQTAEETVEIYEQSENSETDKKSEFRQRFDEIKNSRIVEGTTAKIKDATVETGEKVKEAVTAATPKVRKGLFDFGTKVKSGAEYITFTLMNTLIFLIVWMPCMAITATGVVTTVALICIYLFTGIGFIGICLAGVGCCIVGISFCIWLTGCLMRGKKYE